MGRGPNRSRNNGLQFEPAALDIARENAIAYSNLIDLFGASLRPDKGIRSQALNSIDLRVGGVDRLGAIALVITLVVGLVLGIIVIVLLPLLLPILLLIWIF